MSGHKAVHGRRNGMGVRAPDADGNSLDAPLPRSWLVAHALTTDEVPATC